uniref:Uncharacterized protein n=1 Tax=Lepeophtheirus salmonis TaxID=72036 RepID=A0A0K2SWM7_LEPSM
MKEIHKKNHSRSNNHIIWNDFSFLLQVKQELILRTPQHVFSFVFVFKAIVIT